MNPKYLKVGLEINNDQTEHQIKILDAQTNEIVCRGQWQSVTVIPSVEYNELLFAIYNNEAWISLNSLQSFISKPTIVKEENIIE